jgi:hypothetical protein
MNLLLKLLHAGLDGLVLDVFKKLVLADAAAAAPKLKHGVILVWGIVPMRGTPKSKNNKGTYSTARSTVRGFSQELASFNGLAVS